VPTGEEAAQRAKRQTLRMDGTFMVGLGNDTYVWALEREKDGWKRGDRRQIGLQMTLYQGFSAMKSEDRG
jgi:hypothetical protein